MDLYQFFAWIVALVAVTVGVNALGPVAFVLVVALIVTALTAVGLAAAERARRERTHLEPRFTPTGEVYRDHRTGKVTRVFQDPATGERRYTTRSGDR